MCSQAKQTCRDVGTTSMLYRQRVCTCLRLCIWNWGMVYTAWVCKRLHASVYVHSLDLVTKLVIYKPIYMNLYVSSSWNFKSVTNLRKRSKGIICSCISAFPGSHILHWSHCTRKPFTQANTMQWNTHLTWMVNICIYFAIGLPCGMRVMCHEAFTRCYVLSLEPNRVLSLSGPVTTCMHVHTYMWLQLQLPT